MRPDNKAPDVGSITWVDLTVKDAARVRDFVAALFTPAK